MIKAIFWDNDGVLVDTEHLFFRANQQILKTCGFDLTLEKYIDVSLVQGKSILNLLIDYDEKEIEELRIKRNALYVELLNSELKINDGVIETLDYLHGKYIMGVVTSSNREHFDIIHKTTGMLKYFNFVLTGNDYHKFKPYPEPYLLALERSKCPKEECLAIEDSERGLIAAKSARLKCYVVPNNLTSSHNFSTADKIMNNVKELLSEL